MSDRWNFKKHGDKKRAAPSIQPEELPPPPPRSETVKRLGGRVSQNDVLVVAGLGLLAVGLGMYSLPLAFVAVGVVLLIIGLAGAIDEAVNDGK